MRLSRRVPAMVGTLALAATAVPAFVGAPATAATSPTKSVTVYLKPADSALLTRLAKTSFTDRAARLDELEKAMPSAAAHREVAADLESRGFTVTGQGSWSVRATAPSTLLSTVFGAVKGLLPKLPGVLGSLATAAVTSGGPKIVHAHTALTGGSFRNAYTSVGNTRAGIPPYTGKDRVSRLTVATVQFSGWNSGDLSTYARRHHLRAPSLTQVGVGRSARIAGSDDPGGPIEVALDQESLLSTAPYAHQRAYFAPATANGIAVFQRIADDVRGHHSHIVALSTSWGWCETDNASSRDTINNLLMSIVASGTTVFAATGDDGAYDCTSRGILGLGSRPVIGVDFPASSPYVVAVGGTTLSGSGANRGGNWHESAWTDSGGGVSTVFSGRRVPDIAADANPATGFRIYSSSNGGTIQIGGTSLAAPVSAGLFTNMLASRGFSHGVGNIRPKLHAAAKHGGSFRDITSGHNDTYAATRGHDLITGLGAPLWPALGNRFFTGRRPSVTASLKRKHPHGKHKRWRRVSVHWRGHAPKHTRMITAEVILRQRNGTLVARRSAARPRGTFTFLAKPGRRYQLIVQAGNTHHVLSATKVVTLKVPKHRRHKK